MLYYCGTNTQNFTFRGISGITIPLYVLLALYKMQTTDCKIWVQVTVPISYTTNVLKVEGNPKVPF